MSLIVKEGGTPLPIIPAGVYQGVCYAIYDLGTQYIKQFDKSSHQCMIAWELPTERLEITKDGETTSLPRVVSQKYTMSLGERANLRKTLESWRGRAFSGEELAGFDVSKLIGANCMIQIIHRTKDNKTYANISAIMPLFKGMKSMQPDNDTVIYMLEQGEPPEGTPKWIIEIIHESSEWKAAHGVSEHQDEPPINEPREEDCPF